MTEVPDGKTSRFPGNPVLGSLRTARSILGGISAGVLNGFLGSGGGIVLVFLTAKHFPDMTVKERFATALASILPMSAVSAGFYLYLGQMPPGSLRFLVPAAFGGLLGAFLTEKIPSGVLGTLFSLLMIYAGIRLVR